MEVWDLNTLVPCQEMYSILKKEEGEGFGCIYTSMAGKDQGYALMSRGEGIDPRLGSNSGTVAEHTCEHVSSLPSR